MTPLQSASHWCANFGVSGCAGLGLDDKCQTYRWRDLQDCNIAASRCIYWETCVAPMVRTAEAGQHREELVEAVGLYLKRIHGAEYPAARLNIWGGLPGDGNHKRQSNDRKCPGCGKPLEARKRLCPACAKSRRRESTKAAMSKSRV